MHRFITLAYASMPDMAPTPTPAVDRVLRNVTVTGEGCWIPQRHIMRNGYTQVSVSGKMFMSHRVVYEDHYGPIPEGMVVDHTCRVRACVNPGHLVVTSNQTNILRGTGPSAINAAKTHCKRGHEFTKVNTAIYSGKRICRECNRDYQRRKYAASKN